MELKKFLEFYPIDVLEQLTSNKVLENSHIRLPITVLIKDYAE